MEASCVLEDHRDFLHLDHVRADPQLGEVQLYNLVEHFHVPALRANELIEHLQTRFEPTS